MGLLVSRTLEVNAFTARLSILAHMIWLSSNLSRDSVLEFADRK
jgi:hypothetical protein